MHLYAYIVIIMRLYTTMYIVYHNNHGITTHTHAHIKHTRAHMHVHTHAHTPSQYNDELFE